MSFSSRIRSIEPFVPHPYEVAERALPKGKFDEAMYDNVKKRYARIEDPIIERITYAVDDLTISGVFVHPKEITPGKHPLLIFNRGGTAHYGILILPVILRYLAPFAEQGYLVFGSNYRGNDGSDGNDEMGGSDINDVLTLLDIAKEHPGWDGKNIFMFGGSRGGMMTYLSIKHGVAMNAAATFGAPADWRIANQERPDLEEVFRRRCKEASLEEGLTKRSAEQWPEALKPVPLLLMHGTADESVGVGHSERLAARLEEVGAPHKLVIYENGNHSLSTHAKDMMAETMGWFDAHRT